jgi:hypothetical protein
MKLKNIIPSFIALVALFASCSEDSDPTYLDEVKVSSSIITLPTEGGSVTVTVNAADNWQFAKVFEEKTKDAEGNETSTFSELPAWLSADKLSGSAGETQITFTAGEATQNNDVTLQIQCGGKTQLINVRQFA